jgi:hypothetical protein
MEKRRTAMEARVTHLFRKVGEADELPELVLANRLEMVDLQHFEARRTDPTEPILDILPDMSGR